MHLLPTCSNFIWLESFSHDLKILEREFDDDIDLGKTCDVLKVGIYGQTGRHIHSLNTSRCFDMYSRCNFQYSTSGC